MDCEMEFLVLSIPCPWYDRAKPLSISVLRSFVERVNPTLAFV